MVSAVALVTEGPSCADFRLQMSSVAPGPRSCQSSAPGTPSGLSPGRQERGFLHAAAGPHPARLHFRGRILPGSLRREQGPAHTWVSDFWLQENERLDFRCLERPHLWGPEWQSGELKRYFNIPSGWSVQNGAAGAGEEAGAPLAAVA